MKYQFINFDGNKSKLNLTHRYGDSNLLNRVGFSKRPKTQKDHERGVNPFFASFLS